VTGLGEYAAIAERFGMPIVIAGPEPVDLLDAVARAVRQLEQGRHGVDNQYARAVRPDGNPQAQAAIASVFEQAPATWRGLGRIAGSGLSLREGYRRFDASARFPELFRLSAPAEVRTTHLVADCHDGEILTARMKPPSCPAFGTRCTPDHPLGAAMISAEGTCGAYYRYRRSTSDHPSAPALTVFPTTSLRGG
jgi:hydrogenase expression/formation protein HypD